MQLESKKFICAAVIFLALFFLGVSCFSPGKGAEIIDDARFILYVPPGLEAGKKYPLIVALSPDSNANLMVETWRDNANSYKWIIFASKDFRNGLDLNVITTTVARAVNDVIQKYPVDNSRIIATGFSGGAMGSHALAFLYPTVISGVVANTGKIHEHYMSKRDQYPRGKLTVFLASPGDFRYQEMKRDRQFLEGLGWKTEWIEHNMGHNMAPDAAYQKAGQWLKGEFDKMNKAVSGAEGQEGPKTRRNKRVPNAIDGIMYDGKKSLVVIEGKMYGINDFVGRGKITDISPDVVTLEFDGRLERFSVGERIKK